VDHGALAHAEARHDLVPERFVAEIDHAGRLAFRQVQEPLEPEECPIRAPTKMRMMLMWVMMYPRRL